MVSRFIYDQPSNHNDLSILIIQKLSNPSKDPETDEPPNNHENDGTKKGEKDLEGISLGEEKKWRGPSDRLGDLGEGSDGEAWGLLTCSVNIPSLSSLERDSDHSPSLTEFTISFSLIKPFHK